MGKYYIEEIKKTTFGGDTISIFYIFTMFFWVFKHYEKCQNNYVYHQKNEFYSIEDAQKEVESLKNCENEAKVRKIIKTERILHEHN